MSKAEPRPSVWATRWSTLTLVLIPVGIGVNYVGKLVAQALKLPLWLDSIGTVLSAFLAGPWVGALTGAVNNIIYGLTADPISFWYFITSVAIGLVAGVMARLDYIRSVGRSVAAGLVVAGVATIVSFPINMKLWGGQTGNVWGDALFTALKDSPLWLASFLDELVVDLPDKVLTVLVAFALLRALPRRLTAQFELAEAEAQSTAPGGGRGVSEKGS